MKTEDLKFKIDQLRKDKIIYATEATATALVCILGFMFSQMYFEGVLKDGICLFVLIVGVGYAIFMGIGNSIRFSNIIKLEKKLHSK